MKSKAQRNKLGQFVKGLIPHNIKPVILICKQCHNEFRSNPSKAKHAKFCSRDCRLKHYAVNSKYNGLAFLRKTMTIKQLAVYYGVAMGTIARALLDRGIYSDSHKSESALRHQIKKQHKQVCAICNFDRIVEFAHIIPACDGGLYTFDNTIPLCPNHHRLFDLGKLTENEIKEMGGYHAKR